MDAARLRQLTYISHAALGFSGAVFFVVLTIATLFLFPRIDALIATSNRAANNVTDGTKVWADGAAAEVGQVNKIAHDARASIVATGRLADKMTELAGTSTAQVAQVGPLLASLKTSSDAIVPAVGKIGETAGAATDLLKTTTTAVGQLNDPQHGISPLMAAYMKPPQDLDQILERKAIGQMLDSFAGIAHNGDLITGQFEAVTKKASDDYLGPHPWYTKVGRFASDTYDYGALLARHTP